MFDVMRKLNRGGGYRHAAFTGMITLLPRADNRDPVEIRMADNAQHDIWKQCQVCPPEVTDHLT